MINTICIIALILFSLLVRHKSKANYLPFGILCPLSISAQNTSGGGNGEIIFYLFVLGFLVSIMPERKKPFEKKAMRVVKITILGFLLPLVGFAQKDDDIREGRKLPDFGTALKWNHPDTVHGASTAICYLPLLNACDFGTYKVDFYTYQNDTLYYYNKHKMVCFCDMPQLFDILTPEQRRRESESFMSPGNGRWYAVIDSIDCGYVYTYQVEGTVFAWRLNKITCK